MWFLEGLKLLSIFGFHSGKLKYYELLFRYPWSLSISLSSEYHTFSELFNVKISKTYNISNGGIF